VGSHRAEPATRTLPRAARVHHGATGRDHAVPAPVSSAAAATSGRRRRGATRAFGRVGVLGALVAVTVVVPVTQGALADAGSGYATVSDAALPSTVQALTSTPATQLPPASLVTADAALSLRSAAAVSRSADRSPLPDCDGQPHPGGENGTIPDAWLCTLFDGHTRLRADAAVALAQMNEAFVQRFGADLCLSSGYRSLAEQRAVKATRGSLAADPGRSNHGWGLAIDFCSEETSGARWTWLQKNAAIYGFGNPAWAQPGGSGPYERWHWELTKAVAESGFN